MSDNSGGKAGMSAIHSTVLFRQAALALDRCAEASRRGETAKLAVELRNSVCHLVDALALARGGGPLSTEQRSLFVEQEPSLDRAERDTLLEILSVPTDADWAREQIDVVRKLERHYRASLPGLRAALAEMLPGYSGLSGVVSNLKRCVARWSIPLLAGLASIVAVYHVVDPVYNLQLYGQIFWILSQGESFSENRSQRFRVHVDGSSHPYTIHFEEPISINRMRLDPVNKAVVTEVRIHRIKLVGVDGVPRKDFSFDDVTAWRCINCHLLTDDDGEITLTPLGDDPFIIGPPMEPVEASGMEITMRATARKTLWEWITRLEKTYE